jgi:hypothetical protein
MTRVADWELRFIAFVERTFAAKFDWREFSCLHLGAANVRALRGDDYVLPAIPEMSDATSAAAALEATGYSDLGDVMLTLFEEVPVVMAQRGDIGVSGKSTVICLGSQWLGVSEDGVVTLEASRVQRAFRV